MLIVCTKDPNIVQWTLNPLSGAAQWGNVIILNPGNNQQQATQELGQHLANLGQNEPLCLSAHGNNTQIGDPGVQLNDWMWTVGEIAALLELYVGQAFPGRAYLGTILISACANNVANFSANLAVQLINLQALNGVWIYGYNRAINAQTPYPNPNNLNNQIDLQGTQVLFPILSLPSFLISGATNMSTYSLTVLINSTDLASIYAAQQKLVIQKQNPSSTQLAWLAFDPFQSNAISWTQAYSIYASQTQIQAGATISKLSQTSPQQNAGIIYTFSAGQFQGPLPYSQAPQAYSVTNHYNSLLTFGLAQSANINGNSVNLVPLNAQIVPVENTASFQPIEQVNVFFQSNISNGMVISTITSPSIMVDLTSNTSQTILYQGGNWILNPSSYMLNENLLLLSSK